MKYDEAKAVKMNIKVLGTGCAKCKSLDKLVRQTISELSLHAEVEKVEDIQQIMQYGIMRTPGLIINEKVVLSGYVPRPADLKNIITQNL